MLGIGGYRISEVDERLTFRRYYIYQGLI